jgi:hypothetical protein
MDMPFELKKEMAGTGSKDPIPAIRKKLASLARANINLDLHSLTPFFLQYSQWPHTPQTRNEMWRRRRQRQEVDRFRRVSFGRRPDCVLAVALCHEMTACIRRARQGRGFLPAVSDWREATGPAHEP